MDQFCFNSFSLCLILKSVGGLGWTRSYPTENSICRSVQFNFMIEQWIQTWPRSASFAEYGISCIGPSFKISGHSEQFQPWILSDHLKCACVSDELNWRCNRQKDIGKQACWQNGILEQADMRLQNPAQIRGWIASRESI